MVNLKYNERVIRVKEDRHNNVRPIDWKSIAVFSCRSSASDPVSYQATPITPCLARPGAGVRYIASVNTINPALPLHSSRFVVA